ncbi:hypothetical protein PINS_up004427 [Pythium insidiosum]|nr:hypothetical protein PINS_up004427 [Pythium insidiosum]
MRGTSSTSALSPTAAAAAATVATAPSSHASDPQEEECEALRRESEELCFLRQLKKAHEKALAALRLASEVYGKHSLRLVPFYLVLVDISLQERQIKQAEELLSLVNWLLVKDQKTGAAPPTSTPSPVANAPIRQEVPEELKNLYVVRMNKLYSTLLMELEAFPDALQRAAHGAYHCSLLSAPSTCTPRSFTSVSGRSSIACTSASSSRTPRRHCRRMRHGTAKARSACSTRLWISGTAS